MIHTAEIKRGDDVLDTIHVLDTPIADVIICQEASHFSQGLQLYLGRNTSKNRWYHRDSRW